MYVIPGYQTCFFHHEYLMLPSVNRLPVSSRCTGVHCSWRKISQLFAYFQMWDRFNPWILLDEALHGMLLRQIVRKLGESFDQKCDKYHAYVGCIAFRGDFVLPIYKPPTSHAAVYGQALSTNNGFPWKVPFQTATQNDISKTTIVKWKCP